MADDESSGPLRDESEKRAESGTTARKKSSLYREDLGVEESARASRVREREGAGGEAEVEGGGGSDGDDSGGVVAPVAGGAPALLPVCAKD